MFLNTLCVVFVWFLVRTKNAEAFPSNTDGNSDTYPASVIQEMCSFSTDQFIKYNGYEAEIHNVTTEDGYILKMFRCYSKAFQSKARKPAILQHGLGSSSDVFVLNPGNESLAFILADLGYDVFIPNSRGNIYSRQHVSEDPDDAASSFWRMSWFEMGVYDHPAVIDYVLSLTNDTKVYYAGHSQGTTSLLVLLSMRPEYNQKIRVSSLMAPIAFETHIASKPKQFFESFLQFLPLMDTEFSLKAFYDSLEKCSGCNDTEFCVPPLNDSMDLLNYCRTSTAPLNSFIHYGQLCYFNYFGEFMRNLSYPFDGVAGPVPADFPLSNICSCITLHYSHGDGATNPLDMFQLESKVKSIEYTQIVDDEQFSHVDFIGIKANKLVYEYIVKFWEEPPVYC